MTTPQPDGLSNLPRITRHYALVGYFFKCFTRMETALDRAVEECSRLSFSMHMEATRHMTLEAKAHVLSLYVSAATLNRYQCERYLKYSRSAVQLAKLSEKLIRYRVYLKDNEGSQPEDQDFGPELHPVQMHEQEVIRHAQRCDDLAYRFLEVVDVFSKQSSNEEKIELSALEIEQITKEIIAAGP